MQDQSALIIFVKNLIPGKVKTRLAATVGDENAMAIYRKLLEHTHEVTSKVDCDRYVFYSDFINESDLFENERFHKRKQIGHDLGERMSHAFQSLFDQGYEQLVIIGSDAYELQTKDLERAFQVLDDHHCVIGPATDGGYYLLGLTDMITDLFKGKSWSTGDLLRETESELTRTFKSYHRLRTISDVDQESDLGELSRLITTKKD